MDAVKRTLNVLKENLQLISLFFLWGASIVTFVALLKMFVFSLPMAAGEYAHVRQAFLGDTAIADYDEGVQLYTDAEVRGKWNRKHYYQYSRNALSVAYEKLLDGNGNVMAGREKLAAKIQLLIGNTLYGEEKLQQAAEAYAQALRHEPGNMAAKYNLEFVNKKIEAKSEGDKKNNDPGKGQDGKGGQKGGQQPGKQGDNGKDGQPSDQPGNGKSQSDSKRGGKGKGDGKSDGQNPGQPGGQLPSSGQQTSPDSGQGQADRRDRTQVSRVMAKLQRGRSQLIVRTRAR